MWTPDITVAAVCEKHGRFLLVEELSKSTGQVVFNQPAGHLEAGETMVEAVVRETLEETCCHFTPEHIIGIYRLEATNGKTYIRLRTHWLSPDSIRASDSLRSPIVSNCINDYLSGTRYPLDILKEL